MNTYSEKSFTVESVSKSPSISLGSDKSSSPPASKKSASPTASRASGSGSPSSSRGSSRGSGGSGSSGSGRTSASTEIYGSYDPFYSQKLIKKEFESESCLRLSNCVAVIGVLSMGIHLVECFAYTYLLTAYFIINFEGVPKATNVWWNVVYPTTLVLHTIAQCFFSILLIVGALRRRKSLMLPWIIAGCVEIAFLAKGAVVLAVTSEPASFWIVATAVAFMSVQVFYVILAARLYRRYKREELEVQPPAYEASETKQPLPPSPSSSVCNYLYKV